ncbi:MAG: hypothetical protein PHO92_00205 [Candidatus Peribacteraceae bacterium]|nr:hypothetical protein [Candidatus Peribacteraceae bacterium]
MFKNQPPLWKQIVGAVVGGSLALMIYAGYHATAPQLSKLAGILVLPQDRIDATAKGEVGIADKTLDPDQIERIASRAQRIAADLSSDGTGSPAQEMPIEIVPIELPQEQEIVEAWDAADTLDAEWDESALEFTGNPAFYGETAELPDSGVGAWLAALVALAGATAYITKKKFAADAARA